MLYRPEQYLAMFEGKHGWDRRADTYRPQDDAVHIRDSIDDWEWWYFDFSFDNGYKAVATLQRRNMIMIPHIPTVELSVYPPDGPPRVKYWTLRPSQENYADPDRCLVRMGSMLAEDTGDGYRLVMDMKDLSIDVTFQNIVSSWKPGTGVLFADRERNLELGWVVAIPRGRVHGRLRVDGRNMEVTGSAYHDHNWGNTGMEDPYRGWYWGRIFQTDYTLVYGWVIPREEGLPSTSPLMLARGNRILLSTDQYRLTVEESRKGEKYGLEMPMRLGLTCEGPGVAIHGSLNTNRVVEEMELPRGNGLFYYYRFLADYEAEIEVDGAKERVFGETLHEMMIL